MRRQPRQRRERRTRRSYDRSSSSRYAPSPLWPSHIRTGSYAPPESLAATANNMNWLINWPDALHALLWACWRILVRRDGVKSIHIPANASYNVNEVRAEWRRLHIDSCILSMSNGGMTILVGARQHRWARYTLGRLLAGEAIPAWEAHR